LGRGRGGSYSSVGTGREDNITLLFEFRLWQHGGQQFGVGRYCHGYGSGVRGASGAGGGAGGGARGGGGGGRVHRYHVHVGELLGDRGAGVVLLHLLSEPSLDGVVVAGRREQVVRRWWRLRFVVVLSVVPDAVHVSAQVTGVRQLDGTARVDGIAEEQFGARDHEKEQHQATESGQVPYG